MHATLLHMLSSNSLQAFSGAATTAPLNAPSAPHPIRLVRDQPDARQAASPTIPPTRPGLPPPRGSLLNLSV